MLTTDQTTVVDVLSTYTAAGTSGVKITELTFKNPRAEVTDASTFVFYAVKQGSSPTVVWMDAADPIVSLAPALSVVNASSGSSTINPSPGSLVIVTAAGVTVTLPDPAGIPGQQVVIKSAATGTAPVVVNTLGSAYIDDSFEAEITGDYGSMTVVSDGSNWWIV